MNYKQCYGLIKQVAEKESKNKRYSIEESELAKEIFKREDVRRYPVLKKVYESIVWVYQTIDSQSNLIIH